ncbi:MAG: SET domain-containing protein-lysine N-methyltransferase [Nanoarchaeota archaeon]|nr:SET domain-containing protein-lysine N-methyltransferase [Nanoarchaeota archaeon]MBU4284501.1 SET domain-containing protein-lysine N-methyltransferase [Nanoarchaeota archaeon]
MEKIKCYRSPKTEVRQSNIGGVGLFAKDNISKGEIVFIKAGHIVQYKEAMKCNKDIGEFDVQISDDFFLVPKSKDEIKDLVVHFNHSCNPNAGPDGQITFTAIRNICKGEEITCDYATITTYPYKLECNCGNKECRKVITGDDWKLKELQERYGNHFSWFILKKIKGL